MAKIKLNVSDKPGVKAPEPKITKNKSEETPKNMPPSSKTATKPTVARFKETQPCNFNIEDLGGNKIRATSSAGDKFEGTIKEFNLRLRS